MAWDDTDNEEYEEDEEQDEYEDEDYNLDENGEIYLPSPPYDPMYDMQRIEEIKGWHVEDEIIIVNSEDEIPKYNKKSGEKKNLKNTIENIVFDLQNLDVPGDKNGAKEMR
jgi:hypothetical protein